MLSAKQLAVAAILKSLDLPTSFPLWQASGNPEIVLYRVMGVDCCTRTLVGGTPRGRVVPRRRQEQIPGGFSCRAREARGPGRRLTLRTPPPPRHSTATTRTSTPSRRPSCRSTTIDSSPGSRTSTVRKSDRKISEISHPSGFRQQSYSSAEKIITLFPQSQRGNMYPVNTPSDKKHFTLCRL